MDDMNADCYLNVSDASPNNDFRKGKMVRDRLQGSASRTAEHSVSSQTLSPVHSNGKWVVVVVVDDGWGGRINWSCFVFFVSLPAKASPVTIPARPYPTHPKPMRNSVEGLNQEIEKLVLLPGQPHTCRPESNLVSSNRKKPVDCLSEAKLTKSFYIFDQPVFPWYT